MKKTSECGQEHFPFSNQVSGRSQKADLQSAIHKRLSESMVLNRYVDSLTWEASDDILILKGRLPSFYLKQLLQTALQNLPGITRIDNQVQVTDCRDLDSVTCVRELLK